MKSMDRLDAVIDWSCEGDSYFKEVLSAFSLGAILVGSIVVAMFLLGCIAWIVDMILTWIAGIVL